MTTAVIFGGPSPEHDISILTGLQAGRALSAAGIDPTLIYWTKQATFEQVPPDAEAQDFVGPERSSLTPLEFRIPTGLVEPGRLRSRSLGITVVLNCCHGGPGEDGSLDSLLRLAGIRVTGPGSSACAASMDKLATTALGGAIGIETIPSVSFDSSSIISPPFDPPWVVKPRFGGSSIGVEAGVMDIETAASLGNVGAGRSGLIIQPYLDGWIDLNIAVRRFPTLQVSAIERPEVVGVYDYSTKYLSGTEGMESSPREIPAQLPGGVAATIEESASKLADALLITGAPRIDFLWDGHDRVLLNEINPIPGAFGMYLWAPVGVDRTTFLRDLLAEAEKRPVQPATWNASSDGTALRVAGNIAQKLLT